MTLNRPEYGSQRPDQPVNVNFKPIIRGLKSDNLTETKCKIRFIYVGFNCKRQKWGKKCLEIMTIKGGRAVGLTPNGKKHLKFPF